MIYGQEDEYYQPNDQARPQTSKKQNRRAPKTESQISQQVLIDQSGNSQNQQFIPQNTVDIRAQSAQGFRKINTPVSSSTFKEHGFLPLTATNASHQSMQHQKKKFSMMTQPNLLSGMQQQKDYVKTIPQNILYDKEKLYEELIKTKQIVHYLSGENFKLKTKLQGLQEELMRFTKINDPVLNVLLTSPKPQKNKGTEYSLVPNLKKEITKLQEEVKSKDKELGGIRRSVKLTKISELEVEIKALQDETIRLKHNLQQSLKINENQGDDSQNLENRYINLVNQIQSLQNRNNQLTTVNDSLNAQNQQQIQKIQEQDRIIPRLNKEKAYLKFQIQTLEKQVQTLKKNEKSNQNNFSQNQPHSFDLATSEGQLKYELERKINECNTMSTQLLLKEKKIQDLEKNIKDIEAEFEEKIQDQQARNIKGDEKSGGPTPRTGLTLSKIIPKIQTKDLFFVSIEIKYKLLLQKIDLLTIDNQLFPGELQRKQSITIGDLMKVFQSKPFRMDNYTDIKNLTRFLVEDNNSVTEFDENQSQTLPIIKQQFRTLVNNYTLWKKIDEKKMHEVQKNSDQLLKTFSNEIYEKCPRQSVENGIISLCLSPLEIDYFFMKLFEDSRDVKFINLNKLFSIFTDQENLVAKIISPIAQTKPELPKEQQPSQTRYSISQQQTQSKQLAQQNRASISYQAKRQSEQQKDNEQLQKYNTKEPQKQQKQVDKAQQKQIERPQQEPANQESIMQVDSEVVYDQKQKENLQSGYIGKFNDLQSNYQSESEDNQDRYDMSNNKLSEVNQSQEPQNRNLSQQKQSQQDILKPLKEQSPNELDNKEPPRHQFTDKYLDLHSVSNSSYHEEPTNHLDIPDLVKSESRQIEHGGLQGNKFSLSSDQEIISLQQSHNQSGRKPISDQLVEGNINKVVEQEQDYEEEYEPENQVDEDLQQYEEEID